jgi:hypothetical protein
MGQNSGFWQASQLPFGKKNAWRRTLNHGHRAAMIHGFGTGAFETFPVETG